MEHDSETYRRTSAAHAAAEIAAGLLADARVEAATGNRQMCAQIATRAAGLLREALEKIEGQSSATTRTLPIYRRSDVQAIVRDGAAARARAAGTEG